MMSMTSKSSGMVGLSSCPADAIDEIKNKVDFIGWERGGNGAFREFADFILHSREEPILANNTVFTHFEIA